ncbi:hypothetical protein H0266_14660 [Halobacillus locisalis]|uniref:Loader and inhibitor of phage G40P n=1 Tax=Halobacillus locisalis TaxID=220753 RepID=A0A838CWI4_9BACI|nr:hypothetical protein [Halobacillus locisalis]MBA2176135.1 hypothetical protein [Halobacillus locisalis]
MKREQAIDVLETISELYPQKFDITERVANMLIPKLLEMDYQAVLSKLSDFAVRSPFPPTIGEIAVYEPEKNHHLDQMKQWEAEAAEVSDEIRRQFMDKFRSLTEDKSNES